jgi:hypothetical protein
MLVEMTSLQQKTLWFSLEAGGLSQVLVNLKLLPVSGRGLLPWCLSMQLRRILFAEIDILSLTHPPPVSNRP